MTDDELKALPIIPLRGSDNWRSGYEFGRELERRFPDVEADQLAAATSENGWPEHLEGVGIVGLLCPRVGENDGEHWVWIVSFANGETWYAEGWCDYTGWDCQSGMEWEKAS